MGLFGPSKGTPESAQELIVEFLQSRELDADQALVLDEPNYSIWSVARGSAPVCIHLDKASEAPWISVVCPIVTMPEEGDFSALLRYCMEQNAQMPAPLALEENTISVRAGRPVEGLDKEEVDTLIEIVAWVADKHDNELADKFGCKMIGEDSED